MSQKKIKAIVSEKTIVLHYNGEKINIQKQTDKTLYQELKKLINEGKEAKLVERFATLKELVKTFSSNLIEVEDDGKAYLRGSDQPIPKAIIKKLVELDRDGADFLPLMRFWKKLLQNPSKNSREQLFGFMLANNIPLTEQGDLVVEKGVNQKRGGLPGHLVDCRTNQIDNSVGMIVQMPRQKVNDNPNQECSYGLHVAAPDYVRKVYSSSIIIECVVNPVDVVSVPRDYKNTKMRVCRYQVMGYSGKSSKTQQIVKLEDFLKTPSKDVAKRLKDESVGDVIEHNGSEDNSKVKSKPIPALTSQTTDPVGEELQNKTAKELIEYVENVAGVKITLSLKNKSGILRKAHDIISSYREAQQLKQTNALQLKSKIITPEKGPWSVKIVSNGSIKLQVVKMIKETLGLGLKESKELSDDKGYLLQNISKRQAQRICDKFNLLGSGVKVEMSKSSSSKTTKTPTKVEQKTIRLKDFTKPQLIEKLNKEFNEKIGSRTVRPEVESIAITVFGNAGYKIIS